ncbi:MAG: hypothetical protein NC132_00985 [Corallococcus sp.]|nr:hypothetical protein [Corallococcus sp.]
MILTAINMIFSWIPILNVVIFIICKSLMVACGSTFYICILPDIKKYKKLTSKEVDYDVSDVETVDPDETFLLDSEPENNSEKEE